MRTPPFVRTLAVAWLLVGCNSTTSALRTRFATEKGCSESEVHVTAEGGTQYRASGCNQSTVYVCGDAAMSVTDVRNCAEQDVRRSRLPAEREPPALRPPDPALPLP